MPETRKGFSKTLIGKCGRERDTNGSAESASRFCAQSSPRPHTPKKSWRESKNSGERERRQFCHFPASHPISKFKMGNSPFPLPVRAGARSDINCNQGLHFLSLSLNSGNIPCSGGRKKWNNGNMFLFLLALLHLHFLAICVHKLARPDESS